MLQLRDPAQRATGMSREERFQQSLVPQAHAPSVLLRAKRLGARRQAQEGLLREEQDHLPTVTMASL